jgi:hypothetical protein
MLGKFGRFGNSLFQYVFARSYAESIGAELEIPQDWVGRRIFKDINERSISRSLPKTELDKIPGRRCDIDLFGYFQYIEAFKFLSLNKIKAWLKFQDRWENLFLSSEKYIAAHLRRGDYVSTFSNIFCIVSDMSYKNACHKFSLNYNEIVWVSDERSRYNEMASAEGIDFLPDFFILKNSTHLLRSNSTFSWWAGTLGNAKIYSPLVEDKVGHCDVDFVEGNWPRLIDKKNNHPKHGEPGDFHIPE